MADTHHVKRHELSVCLHLMGKSKEEGTRLFSVMPDGKMGGSGHKLKYRKFRLNI